MHDLQKVVPVTNYEVSVNHRIGTIDAVRDTLFFSEVNSYYNHETKKGVPVKKHHSLNTLLERLNNIKVKLKKDNSIDILKGLYKDGTKGSFCYKNSPFLFFDIDVKDTENTHLKDHAKNVQVFERLKEIAVLVWRSHSGQGMAGILFVPQMEKITHADNKKHLCIGKSICNYLKETLNVNASFDNAQSKYRQIRYLAKQDQKQKLNPNPYILSYDIKEIQETYQTGVVKFRYSDNRGVNGSIADQFNKDNSIHNVLINCGFTKVNSTRYKHPRTSSATTGAVKDNVFLNASSSFSHYKVFTPYFLMGVAYYDCDFKKLNEDLKNKGYTDKPPTKEAFKQAKNTLKTNTMNRDEQIFEACYHLKHGTLQQKQDFIKKNAKTEAEKIKFSTFLNYKQLQINYDKTLTVKKYVSEQMQAVLSYADEQKKIILTAETGIGKSTSFLKEFSLYRPNKRLLIIAPLTVIVEQIANQYSNVVCLTGNSDLQAHSKAKTNQIVVATYEQGIKQLEALNTFDYFVVDEVHNFIVSNSYKRDTLAQVTYLLKKHTVIGLTGTTNPLFKNIGYKLLNVQKLNQKKVPVSFIVDNRAPFKIAMQHLREHQKGKTLLRINSRSVAQSIKQELIRTKKYKSEQILILNADLKIKKGKDFKGITQNSSFSNAIQIVITTALIDEGVSIKQKGFTNVVFIENKYNPMPEAVKQFFARFRNEDTNRKNYYYYKETKERPAFSFCPKIEFKEKKAALLQEAKKVDVLDTNKKDIANTRYLFYKDGTLNPYALAYDVSKKFSSLMSKNEYFFYLENNFNLEITEVKNYATKKINDSGHKAYQSHKKTLIGNNWVTCNDEVLNALYRITDNKSVKQSINFTGLNPSNEIFNLVSDNLKDFETLQSTTVTLERLGEQQPHLYLLDADTNKLLNPSKANRRIKLLQNLSTINNPATKTDQKNKTKLLQFVKLAHAKSDADKKTLFTCWNKQRCYSVQPSYHNLLDLVNYFKEKNGVNFLINITIFIKIIFDGNISVYRC